MPSFCQCQRLRYTMLVKKGQNIKIRYIHMKIHIYISRFTYIYQDSNIYIYIKIRHIYMSRFANIYIKIHIYISRFTYIYQDSHIYIKIHIYISRLYIYQDSHIYIKIHIYISRFTYIYISRFAYISRLGYICQDSHLYIRIHNILRLAHAF